MAKTSTNISDKLFFTINHFNNTGYIGELAGEQRIVIRFTSEEMVAIKRMSKYIDDIIIHEG